MTDATAGIHRGAECDSPLPRPDPGNQKLLKGFVGAEQDPVQ
jgi:hypothetical protein